MWEQAVSGAVQVVGAIMEARAANQQGKIAQMASQMEANKQRFEGAFANLQMQEQAYQWVQQGQRMHSTQTVSAAAAGVSLDSTSFREIQAETRVAFEQDARKMLMYGRMYELGALGGAAMSEIQGTSQAATGQMNAMAILVNRGSQMWKMWGGSGGIGG